MNAQRLTYLFDRYYHKTGTPEERQELLELINKSENDPVINNLVGAAFQQTKGELEMNDEVAAAILEAITRADKEQQPAIVRPLKGNYFRKMIAAAIIILLLGAGSYYLFLQPEKQVAKVATQQPQPKNDLLPGGNKAILTLDDGTRIVLDSAANGTLTQQGDTKIIKLDSGQLMYKGTGNNHEITYNTITTPRGGQYIIVLADGSKVWLNAASSLRYPTGFNGKERKVELTGEGYFEVAKNAAMPFRVTVNNLSVEVLGTHFNINAYNDEKVIKTTLLEGSVKVSVNTISKMIKPGQQALVFSSGGQQTAIKVQEADTEEAIAWKNGFFQFNRTDLASIMRQISRWYNVDVEYEGKLTNRSFSGIVSKNSNVSEVMKIMQQANIHFRIEGNTPTGRPEKIIVTP